MISQEKTMLYLTDFPITTTIPDVQIFLSEYKEKIRFIQQDQNQKNKDKRKPLAIKVLFNNYESAKNVVSR